MMPKDQSKIAIVGIGSIFAEAKNFKEYWKNILNKKECFGDVFDPQWDINDYYDPTPGKKGKAYAKKVARIPNIDFSPLEFGIPPKALESIGTHQLLALEIAKSALMDAGLYGKKSKEFDRERIGVILAASVGENLVNSHARHEIPTILKMLRSAEISPSLVQDVKDRLEKSLIDWNEDVFPGFLAGVVAGRICNRFNFGGTSYAVEAACAGSHAAIKAAVHELQNGDLDIALAGGVNIECGTFNLVTFSQTPALSRSEQCTPFDERADGILLGNGVGMVVLKRLEDAERDGDRIYAVMIGIGNSSDGRSSGIYTPNIKGQIRALKNTYERFQISPKSIGLLEAHGTGTPVGDATEIKALSEIYRGFGCADRSIPIGSVKAQIGHTRQAAGIAGIIKASLSLYHKVIPSMNLPKDPKTAKHLQNSPFFVPDQSYPWINNKENKRRAAVSAFGFGGSNYHMILEEYKPQNGTSSPYRIFSDAKAYLFFAETREELVKKLKKLKSLSGSEKDEACRLSLAKHTEKIDKGWPRIGFVSSKMGSFDELLDLSIELMEQKREDAFDHPRGIYYSTKNRTEHGKVVALFSGQGSQKQFMGSELSQSYPELLEAFSLMDQACLRADRRPLSELIFPQPPPTAKERSALEAALIKTENAQPAVAALSAGLYRLLKNSGFKADFLVGHSFGELTALWAASAFDDETFFNLTLQRAEAMGEKAFNDGDHGMMLAANLSEEELKQRFSSEMKDLSLSNFNTQNQIVLAGSSDAITAFHGLLKEKNIKSKLLAVSAAFHSKYLKPSSELFARALKEKSFNTPAVPVYSNVTGSPFPHDQNVIKKLMSEQISQPVRFRQAIESIYEQGGRIFVEFGPRTVLTRFVEEILKDKMDVLSTPLMPSPHSLEDYNLKKALLQLKVWGLPITIDPYYADDAIAKNPAPEKGSRQNRKLPVPITEIDRGAPRCHSPKK